MLVGKDEQGFTLMEFMIASLVLTVSMLAYVSALPTSVQVMHRASSYSEAVALTQQRAETIRNLSFANILLANGVASSATGSHATAFTLTTTVAAVGAAPNRYADVTVLTTWTEQGQAKNLRLAFVVAES